MTNYNEKIGRRGPAGRQISPFFHLAALALLLPRVAVAQATTYEVLYSFKGSPDGTQPKGAVVIGTDGALYGTTYTGGTSQLGTVFRLVPAAGVPWSETVLHNFTGPDGQYPSSALVFDAGSFYGATEYGGTGGAGTIFELAQPATAGDAWTETVLYDFVYSKNSQNVAPNGPLVIAPGGTIFTAVQGAPAAPLGPRIGAVIALVPPAALGGDWAEYEIYPLGFDQGEWPFASVVSEGGSLFGATYYGGAEFCNSPYGCGTVYELTPPAIQGNPWTETTLHTFGTVINDGADPGALTVGPGGVLYGTTQAGGSGSACQADESGCGTVFQLTPTSDEGGGWMYSVIYSFTGINGDGAVPVSSVVVGKSGSLYGMTQNGGSATTACPGSGFVYPGCGTVFQLMPPSALGGTWTEKVLHSFSGTEGDGSMPVAGLALSPDGVLYGTTSAGGTAGKGTVFAIVP
jgi:uncharacterized repeat protein (TIGR03803 family)